MTSSADGFFSGASYAHSPPPNQLPTPAFLKAGSLKKSSLAQSTSAIPAVGPSQAGMSLPPSSAPMAIPGASAPGPDSNAGDGFESASPPLRPPQLFVLG